MSQGDERQYDTVVFDLGGVLVDWDPTQAFAEHWDEAGAKDFLDEIGFDELNRGIDGGRPIAEVAAEVDARHPHHAGRFSAYQRNFPATLTGEVPGTADIVRELARGGTRLLALTNWSAETFPHARELFPVLGEFEAIVVSGAERLLKPDPAIFRLLLDRHQVDPATTAYVDDSAANVAGAAGVGLTALRFTDAATLRADLAGLGLPVATA